MGVLRTEISTAYHRNGLVNEKDMLWNVWQWKRYALERLARREKGVLRAAHTYTANIRECPPPPPPPGRYPTLESTHFNTTNSLQCNPSPPLPPPPTALAGIQALTFNNHHRHALAQVQVKQMNDQNQGSKSSHLENVLVVMDVQLTRYRGNQNTRLKFDRGKTSCKLMMREAKRHSLIGWIL